jgi:hypothetical protein
LPDGLVSYQKSQFGYILEGLGKENVGIFYDHLEYFTALWCMLWPFGTVCGHLVHFSCFGMCGTKKSGNPGGNAKDYYVENSATRLGEISPFG